MTAARSAEAAQSGRGLPRRVHRPAATLLVAGVIGLVAAIGTSAALGLSWVATFAAGCAFVAGLGVATTGLRVHPHPRLGGANLVTLTRMAMLAVLLAILLDGAHDLLAVMILASAAVGMDGLDGYLARRQGLHSRFGAHFDMEVDSVLALVLASLAALGAAGPLALVLGVPRYAFGAAALALPWVRRPLPPRASRKVVCVVQMITLIALQLPLDSTLAIALVLAAAGPLAWSFGVDLLYLRRTRRRT